MQARSMVLPLMLALLLGALLQPQGSELAKALFVVHFGLFIIWQPFIEGTQRLSLRALAGLLLVLVGITVSLDARLLMLWIMLLAGVVGGKVMLSGARSERWFYLVALAFLALALLLLATPAAFVEADLPDLVTRVAVFGLPFLLATMLVLPRSNETAHAAEVVDFINSVFVFLLLAVLVLGSLAAMLLFKYDYATSLFYTLLVLGAVLLVLGWVWNPHGGFSGVGEFFSRYLMSIGLPAEQWLQALADHAVREEDPDRFIERALADMSRRVNWLHGVEWMTATGAGVLGKTVGRRSVFSHRELRVTLRTNYSLSPALAWHFQLLVQLLGEFHADKLRAVQLKQLFYLQAVHETGARLTHDVKNILQSLETLCHAAEEADAENSPEFRALLRRQLPALVNRLGATLTKLQSAQDDSVAEQQAPQAWWSEVGRRYPQAPWMHLEARLAADAMAIPAAVFSSVLENLLANVEEKRATDRNLEASVLLNASAEAVSLSVCDNGEPVPADIVGRLLQAPVPSVNGLGIGLFQAARLARTVGLALELRENRPGRVCFVLAGPARGAAG